MISNLTGLRFFMAYWVVLYHVKEAVEVPVLSEIVDAGYLGVDVFFILSGYILTHVYHDDFFKRGVTFKQSSTFIKRRFARIYPLHFFSLIFAIVFLWSLKQFLGNSKELPYDHILPQVFLVHAWGSVKGLSWNFPSWSVSAEWFAYLLIFPVAHFSYRKGGLTAIGLVTLSFFIGFVMITMFYFGTIWESYYGGG